MKKNKLLLFPVMLGMFLCGCDNENTDSGKATIAIEANQYMTTTLKTGEYELNKAIDFTINPINEEYKVSVVKMNDVVIAASNGNSYSFTPVEAKTYTLKVTTEELANKVVYTFEGLTEENYQTKLFKKGTKLACANYVVSAGFDNVFKNNKFYVEENRLFDFDCRILGENVPSVWIRRIEFSFADNKNGLNAIELDPTTESYENGVWTTTKTKGNQGTSTIKFKGTEAGAEITKIVLTTQDAVEDAVPVEFNGLDADDKVFYFQGGPNFEAWQNKVPLTVETKFKTLQNYCFYIEWGVNHKKFYDVLHLRYNGQLLVDTKFFPDPDSGLPMNQIVVYTFSPKESETTKATITAEWGAKEASNNIKVNVEKGNQYVKRFMETDPLGSLGITTVLFGGEAQMQLRPKRGYMNLKVDVNGVIYEKDDTKDLYIINIPFAETINISFSAIEGDEDMKGKTLIPLTGEAQGKGNLISAEDGGIQYILFEADENHPLAELTSLSFNGSVLEPKEKPGEDEGTFYTLTNEQKAVYDATSDKKTLFTATVKEEGTYTSSILINKGLFSAEIVGKEATEEGEFTKFEVDGKSSTTIKFTPNQNLDLHSVEVNDHRLNESEYTLNPDGSISYTFTANAKNYEFLVQTKPQLVKLELDPTSTPGYKIDNLPTEKVEVGQPLNLTLAPADTEHWLEGKVINVTYNSQPVSVDPSNFQFTILPVKDVSLIKVVVQDS